MEKINVKLLDLFNVDSDRYKDLSELYVQKVDIYKAKASVNIIIDGVESLSGKNSLVSFVHDLENDFGTLRLMLIMTVVIVLAMLLISTFFRVGH